ncbi:hypothetical protein KQX54_002403 [Cotesia glomerata]|uniref:Uncharacterized protein n=1 Tax=Cotesia glomerata TaxID=32391 RepID=A0AAV7HUT3_COTGL|nr:hypothetical protein KQX54_002403 [Cotesia glomerata]
MIRTAFKSPVKLYTAFPKIALTVVKFSRMPKGSQIFNFQLQRIICFISTDIFSGLSGLGFTNKVLVALLWRFGAQDNTDVKKF